jgi:glycosyltransferase involved in cell wall biosynthesis
VATAVDGTPEVVVHEKTGLLVEAGDAPHLAGAIRRLLRDEPLRRDLASTGRQWVAERFDQQLQVQRTQALYLRALNGIPAQP